MLINELYVTTRLDVKECIRRFKEYEFDLDNPDLVLPQDQTPLIDKYDTMVPEKLLRKAFLYNQMDLPFTVQIFNDVEINNDINCNMSTIDEVTEKEKSMLNKYVILDIENPNSRGNSICAIAVITVENNIIIEKNILLLIQKTVLMQ
ncbi:MAG: hypothetical protein IJA10_11910 [Lachnospiraceae bacterium]|nr:hypothetical protein [Lachnospiraceae bacterium]